MTNRKTYSVRLDPDLMTKIKIKAAKDDTTISAILESLINKHLDEATANENE